LATLTVENYVKTIFRICGDGTRPAATGEVAAALRVSPGTVTSMLKTLSEAGLATYTPYEGVRLSQAGDELALKIVRRHRLIELFLTRVLGLGWDEVHEDAEQLEHAVSDRLIERIDAFLGRPEFDPHGDPIPSAQGTLARPDVRPLAECPPGCRFQLSRVLDQSADFLRYLRDAGLGLATVGLVVANQPEAGILTIRLGDRETTLGLKAARQLLVAELNSRPTARAPKVAPANA